MILRKLKNTVIMAAITCLLAGCFSTPKTFKDIEYSEIVSSILISQDKKKLVVIGKQYHYIFDAPKVIIDTLKSSFHQSITAKFHPFHVDSDGFTTGVFEFISSKKVTGQQLNEMLKLGYKPYSEKSYNKGYIVIGELKGIRYMSGNIIIPNKLQNLNNKYKIKVLEQHEKATNALISPITVTPSAVMLIGVMPLALFTSILSVSLQ